MKRKITMVIIGVMCCFLLFGCKKDPQDAKISRMTGSFDIDVYSLPELFASADYAMIGKVIKETGTSTVAPDYYRTNYKVEVVENLKGELRQDKPIKVSKKGGVTEDGSECLIHGGDILPVENGTYLFFIYAQPDGSNLASGPNSTIPLDDNATKTNLATRVGGSPLSNGIAEVTNKEFDKFSYEEKKEFISDAMNTKMSIERKRFVSDDDVSKQ